MSARRRFNKKQKCIIAVTAVILLILSCVFFYIWATIEVGEQTVDFDKLKSKIGKYVSIPEYVGEYATKCKILYPRAEEGSKRRCWKYTNLTIRNKYFIGYYINFIIDNNYGSIIVQNSDYREKERGDSIAAVSTRL